MDDPPLCVEADEYSQCRSEMMGDDEAWSKSMTCRPVRVRSRPIFHFPVGGCCCAAVDHQTGHSNHPVGMAEMNLAWGSKPAHVPFDRS